MSTDYPSISFPKRVNPHDERREVFANYGMFGHMYCDSSGKTVFQNLKDNNSRQYAALHPVMPLESSPESAQYPFQDRVMGHYLSLNAKIKTFLMTIKCKRPRYTRLESEWFQYVAKTHLEVLDCLSDQNRNPDAILEEVGYWNYMHLTNYIDVHEAKTVMFNNSAYVGGCLGHFSSTHGLGYLLSPGSDFDMLTVRQVTQATEGLLQSEIVSEYQMEEPVFEVQCGRVQGQDFVLTRAESEALLFSFKPEGGEDDMLEELCEMTPVSEKKIRSIHLSPYIPGECLVTTEGECSIWSGDELVPVYSPSPLTAPVNDQWCGGYFGSHPRQLVYADVTRVQLVDLRAPELKALELLSVPSSEFHKTELVRVCHQLNNAGYPFHHLIGTDFSLVLMDERFLKHPVLHMDHMLTCPPQYFSVLTQPDSAEILTYIGCQNPADAHGFKMSITETKPPQSISVPWRAAQMQDLAKWPQFTENCTNPHLLKKRMEASLAGIQAVHHGNGHAIFQMNCHGEIFHQVFEEDTSGGRDVTFSAGMGSHNLTPQPVALERGMSWIKKWEEFMRKNDKGFAMLQTNLFAVFEHMVKTAKAPHPECPLCHPGGCSETSASDQTDEQEEETKCKACDLEVEQGRQLLDSTKNQTLMDPDPACDRINLWSHLKEPDQMPASNALTKLLLKHWNEEDDVRELYIERTLEIKDRIKKLKEIISKGPAAAKGDNADGPDVTDQDNDAVGDKAGQASDNGGSSSVVEHHSRRKKRKRKQKKKEKGLNKNKSEEDRTENRHTENEENTKSQIQNKDGESGDISEERQTVGSGNTKKKRRQKHKKITGENKDENHNQTSKDASIEISRPSTPPPSQHTHNVFKTPVLSPLGKAKQSPTNKGRTYSETTSGARSETVRPRLDSENSVDSASQSSSLDISMEDGEAVESGSDIGAAAKRRKVQNSSDSDSSFSSGTTSDLKKRKQSKLKKTFTAGF